MNILVIHFTQSESSVMADDGNPFAAGGEEVRAAPALDFYDGGTYEDDYGGEIAAVAGVQLGSVNALPNDVEAAEAEAGAAEVEQEEEEEEEEDFAKYRPWQGDYY